MYSTTELHMTDISVTGAKCLEAPQFICHECGSDKWSETMPLMRLRQQQRIPNPGPVLYSILSIVIDDTITFISCLQSTLHQLINVCVYGK